MTYANHTLLELWSSDRYANHVLKVVAGLAIALITYGEIDSYGLWDPLIFGTLFLLGVFLAVHGLFTGIEASIAAGVDRPAETRS
ncbi:hypothetical protein [Natrinema gelatinilyticum]|uniref:hypothetical protein n=1 Tax=Natrinema gelatinilyticum TaxID=2961571 RepID=UPI0020C58975|nr:hypothetical protein [Natrinema gelatinilyticum]